MENDRQESEYDAAGWAGDVHPAACPPEMLRKLAENGKRSIERYKSGGDIKEPLPPVAYQSI